MNVFLIIIPLFGILFLAFILSLSWREIVKGVLVLIIIEGALRKWVLPQASNVIYLFKDFILVIAYVKFFVLSYKKRPLIHNNYSSIAHIFLLLASIWFFIQSFNPDLGSPIVGLFGLSRYVLYVPLMWIVPYLFDSEEEFYQFLRNYFLCLIPVGILGIAQFYSPASSLINIAPGGEEAAAELSFGEDGKLFRISSTFGFNNLYVGYLVFNFSFLLPFLIGKEKKTRWLWKNLIFLELFLMIANFFMTGSRAVVIYSGFIFLGYLSIKSIYNLSTIVKFLRKLALPALVMAFILPYWFAPALDAFLSRITNTSDVSNRFSYNLSVQTESGKSFSFIDGYGTGATHGGSQPIKKIFSVKNSITPPGAEAEVHRIKIEVGLIGVIFWYGMRIALLASLLVIYRRLQTPFLKDIALVTFFFHLQLLPGQVVFHPVNIMYYWFVSGFIFLLPRLESKNFPNYQ